MVLILQTSGAGHGDRTLYGGAAGPLGVRDARTGVYRSPRELKQGGARC